MTAAQQFPRSDPSWPAVVDAILRADHAWQSPSALARRLNRDVEALTDTLAEMDHAGWLQLWERPDGVMVTLSAWAANRRGASLIPAGAPGVWRWSSPSRRRPHTFADRPAGPRPRPVEPNRNTPHALPASVGAG